MSASANILAASKAFFLASFLILQSWAVQGQNDRDKVIISQETNVETLKRIAAQANVRYSKNKNNAARLNIAEEITVSNNRRGYLSGFDSTGNPVYDFDDNIEVARTLRVNKIWNDGSGILELDGTGVLIGHWEAGGLALTTHQDLRNRVTKAESAQVTSHATHTAGTMIGEGVHYSSRGMANGARIVSRRSNNDEAELAEFAISGGILSNHSYSTGDPDGNIPVYGQYTENAAEWDEILYNAPYLMVCKSAGNTRNDGVNESDEGYDLVFTIATSKNLLTVGAVHDVLTYNGPESVDQAVFSSWGPTDDWRVKPDVVTSGVGVQSADNSSNTAYDSKSGTSMAVAATTGSIALLQQHYHNENNQYMKSATVKALLIATTDEAGTSPGPDFQNGWGLLNIERAAQTISNRGGSSIIEEITLTNGETFSQDVFIDGTSPVTLAIAWTDPAGSPSGALDSQQPRLVNDLDLRITGNSSTYEPWKFAPNSTSNNFEAPAVKGDNYRDNVEKIEMGFVSEGTYSVKVTHKNLLFNDSQKFSLVITGLKEDIVGLPTVRNDMISIYPVPSRDGLFHLVIPSGYGISKNLIQLYNTQGKLISSEVFNKPPNKLDYSNQESGIYYLKMVTSEGVIIKRLQIDK